MSDIAISASPPVTTTQPIAKKEQLPLRLDQTPKVSAELLDSLMEGGAVSLAEYAASSELAGRIVANLAKSCQCTPEECKLALRYMLLLASCGEQEAVINFLFDEKVADKSRAWYLSEMAWRLGFDQSHFKGYSNVRMNLQAVVESFADWSEEREMLLNGDEINASDLQASLLHIDEEKKPLVIVAGLLVEICYKAETASKDQRLQQVKVLQNGMESLPEAAPVTSGGVLIDQNSKA